MVQTNTSSNVNAGPQDSATQSDKKDSQEQTTKNNNLETNVASSSNPLLDSTLPKDPDSTSDTSVGSEKSEKQDGRVAPKATSPAESSVATSPSSENATEASVVTPSPAVTNEGGNSTDSLTEAESQAPSRPSFRSRIEKFFGRDDLSKALKAVRKQGRDVVFNGNDITITTNDGRSLTLSGTKKLSENEKISLCNEIVKNTFMDFFKMLNAGENAPNFKISKIEGIQLPMAIDSKAYGVPLAENVEIKRCTFTNGTSLAFKGENITFEGCTFGNCVSITVANAKKITLTDCKLPDTISSNLIGDKRIIGRTRALKFVGKTEELTFQNSYGLIDQELIKIVDAEGKKQIIEFLDEKGKKIDYHDVFTRYKGSLLKKGNMPMDLYNALLAERGAKDKKVCNDTNDAINSPEDGLKSKYVEAQERLEKLEKEKTTMSDNLNKKGWFGLPSIRGRLSYAWSKLRGKGKESDIKDQGRVVTGAKEVLIRAENQRRKYDAYCGRHDSYKKVEDVSIDQTSKDVQFTDGTIETPVASLERRVGLTPREKKARLGFNYEFLSKLSEKFKSLGENDSIKAVVKERFDAITKKINNILKNYNISNGEKNEQKINELLDAMSKVMTPEAFGVIKGQLFTNSSEKKA